MWKKKVSFSIQVLFVLLFEAIAKSRDFRSPRYVHVHSSPCTLNKIKSANILRRIRRISGGTISQKIESDFQKNMKQSEHALRAQNIFNGTNIIFSDVDGTLVHYPDIGNRSDTSTYHQDNEAQNKIIFLPASSTGMRGTISSKTLELCQNLRRNEHAKLILVSGMRTSTLITRLPYLPRADAYASEAGGRIFYPVTSNDNEKGEIMVTPVQFDGATDEDLKPFGLVEDEQWRLKLSEATGTDGYVGDSMDVYLGKQSDQTPIIPIDERKNGEIWNFARILQKKGYVIDYKGYSNCFRVNKKQQVGMSDEDFDKLQTLNISAHGLASSINLGCVDFYPDFSGKKNCCAYLALHFMDDENKTKMEERNDDDDHDGILDSCICLCDDDNDLEMAAACGKVFLPSVSSTSMEEAATSSPEKFVVTENKANGIVETRATEKALLEAAIEFQGRIR